VQITQSTLNVRADFIPTLSLPVVRENLAGTPANFDGPVRVRSRVRWGLDPLEQLGDERISLLGRELENLIKQAFC
jgi:hypothetical protein